MQLLLLLCRLRLLSGRTHRGGTPRPDGPQFRRIPIHLIGFAVIIGDEVGKALVESEGIQPGQIVTCFLRRIQLRSVPVDADMAQLVSQQVMRHALHRYGAQILDPQAHVQNGGIHPGGLFSTTASLGGG